MHYFMNENEKLKNKLQMNYINKNMRGKVLNGKKNINSSKNTYSSKTCFIFLIQKITFIII